MVAKANSQRSIRESVQTHLYSGQTYTTPHNVYSSMRTAATREAYVHCCLAMLPLKQAKPPAGCRNLKCCETFAFSMERP